MRQHNKLTLKEIARWFTPPIFARGWRQLAWRWNSHSGLEVRYEIWETLPTASDNARGTHLNESGDARSVAEYVATFDAEQEMQNPIVAENLRFIEVVISPRLPPEASVLDVGCGIGRYARFLRRPNAPTRRWSYAGVDRSESIVAQSRLLCPECEFRSTEGSVQIPYPNQSYDLVMASSMLQYTRAQWRDALQELRRVARQLIFIARLPVLRLCSSTYCRQTVWERGQATHHYLRLFNRDELETTVTELNCRIVAHDYTPEILNVEGLPEPAVCNQYLLAV